MPLKQVRFDYFQPHRFVHRLTLPCREGQYFARRLSGLEPITLACYILVATLHLFCGVSIEHCHFVLEVLRSIVTLVSEASTSLISKQTVSSIYSDIRTVVDIMDLEPKTKAFVCCPKCFFLYNVDTNDPQSSYPEHCTHRDAPDSEPCGRRLRKQRKRQDGHVELPSREFLYQDMKQWVASLYARSDLKDHLEPRPSLDRIDPNEISDIWDAPCLQEFLGPDGKTPFINGPANEGRLIFSLNMDGFNPYRNMAGGKRVSVGAIYMVCLNLPAALRFKVENMYLVAIIPGPRQPSTHEINYLLRPLVDDLIDFWQPGIYLTRTFQRPNGMLVRCAVVPLVCDLPAARQMSGFAHYTSRHFCSECYQTLDDINDLNYESWEPRTYKNHLAAAETWRDAETLADRENAFKVDGIRWSELLRLPYWDPTKFTAIDSMHAFYLRLLSHHCRHIWGMNANVEDGDGVALGIKDKEHTTESDMRKGHKTLDTGTRAELSTLPVGVIRQLCRDIGLETRGRKGKLVNGLLQYVGLAILYDLRLTHRLSEMP
jgi:Transposase family tnp2